MSTKNGERHRKGQGPDKKSGGQAAIIIREVMGELGISVDLL